MGTYDAILTYLRSFDYVAFISVLFCSGLCSLELLPNKFCRVVSGERMKFKFEARFCLILENGLTVSLVFSGCEEGFVFGDPA